MASTRQLCTFALDGLWYGLDVQDVQEVVHAPRMTPVPLASGLVSGLINLRGQIIVAVDLLTYGDCDGFLS